MNRRELFKRLVPLAGVPIVVNGKNTLGYFELPEPGKKYIIFADPRRIDIKALIDSGHFPEGTTYQGVWLGDDQTIDQVIRIFTIQDNA